MARGKITGRAYPLGRANVDTDIIISAEWLKTISRHGLGKVAFERLRSTAGNLFDDPQFRGSPILVAGENFGCGSSREHAAWALSDMGVEAVIAPSFADIFSSNAFKNGIATILLPQQAVDRLLAEASAGQEIEIDLGDQRVVTQSGEAFDFPMDAFRKRCLLENLDEIALTLGSEPQIRDFEARLQRERRWILPRRAA
jgi:3-isopropylmalate dehydratase small subunit